VTGAVFALAGLLLLGGQERSESPRAEGEGSRRGGPEEALKMIDAYVVSNLQESLELTDEQFVKLLPLVKKLQSDRRAVVLRRQQPLMELRRLLGSGAATEEKVKELLRRVKAAEAEEPVVLARDREAIDSALSPVQQAKFRVFEAEVEHKIRELMTQIRAERRGKGESKSKEPGERRPRP
jgi:hypothetical protein